MPKFIKDPDGYYVNIAYITSISNLKKDHHGKYYATVFMLKGVYESEHGESYYFGSEKEYDAFIAMLNSND